MGRFEFGTYMAEQHPIGIKIAFVGTVDQVWPDRFMETIAVTRGVITKVVTETEEALNWLAD